MHKAPCVCSWAMTCTHDYTMMRPWPRVNSKPRLTLPYCSLQGVITQPNHDVEYDERPPSRKVYEREAGSSGAGQSEAAAKSALSQTSRTEAVLPRNTDPRMTAGFQQGRVSFHGPQAPKSCPVVPNYRGKHSPGYKARRRERQARDENRYANHQDGSSAAKRAKTGRYFS